MPSQKRESRPAGTGRPISKANNNSPANKPKRANAQAARLAADPRFQRRVTAVWQFGPGVLALLLGRLADEHDCAGQVLRYLDGAIEHAPAIRQYGLDRRAAP